MARINIDDELHANRGFKRLVARLGDADKAIGMVYRFKHLAQDYWSNERALMSKEEFLAEGFGIILEVGHLAEETPDGIQYFNAEEEFAWYLQKCRASRAATKARIGKKPTEPPKPPSQNTGSNLPDHRNDPPGAPEEPSRSTGTNEPNVPTAPAPASIAAPVTATPPAPVPARARDSTASEVSELRAHVDACSKTWGETMAEMGCPGEISPHEQVEITREIQKHAALPGATLKSAADYVELALFGARFETKSEKFSPEKHLSLGRVFGKGDDGKDRIGKFANLGRAGKKRQAEKAKTEAEFRARQEAGRCPDNPPDRKSELDAEDVRFAPPADLKAQFSGIFKTMPGATQ